jgi:phage baseplate assembly protein W
MPSLVEQQRAEPVPKYGKSWLFNFEKGDFVLDSAGRVVPADEHAAWVQWCVKTVLTERFTYAIYSSDYGAEVERALKQPSRKAVEAELERSITEALLADPRTELVKDFAFEWQGDAVKVGLTVVPVVGPPKRLEVAVNG